MVKGGICKCSVSLCETSVRGAWRRAPLLGTLKDMIFIMVAIVVIPAECGPRVLDSVTSVNMCNVSIT